MNTRPDFLVHMRRRLQRHGRALFLGTVMSLGIGGIALAAIAPDVRHTRHNLSVSNDVTAAVGSSFGTTVKATSETQICVFCHTPHAANISLVAPLWNRAVSNSSTYTFYNSTSLDASPIPGTAGVGDGSKICLSCHDGTLAIGTVGVLNAKAPNTIAMQGTNPDGTMAVGSGETSGFTRRIGTNLTNDHPISFTYDAAQADRDGELYKPGESGVAVAGRVRGQPKPQFPLIGATDKSSGQMECVTCHDPHLKTNSVDPVTGLLQNNKFLRGNRFQVTSPTVTTSGQYDASKDIICLACHNKPTWATSTHSNKEATSEQYKDSDADLRDFPRGMNTWRAACTNCHDMHTVQGSRRLLREAVMTSGYNPTGAATPSPRSGGSSAIERVCFQCHSPAGERVLVQDAPDQVPDIKTDFSMPIHMPIVTAQQGIVPLGGGPTNNTEEKHNIGTKAVLSEDVPSQTSNNQRGIDFMESRSLLGGGGHLENRHAECTDCHQPHRVTRTQLFNADPTIPAITGTHRHAGSKDSGGVPHNNLASGSQRGAFGVEPVYTSPSFFVAPTSFIEKKGAAGNDPKVFNASTAVTSTWLTREYQICAKCHSNYSLDTNLSNAYSPRPSLGREGGTPYGTNGMTIYTNVLREIQAPVTHRGNATPGDSGAFKGRTPYVSPASNYNVDFQVRNRRSWHPVMGPTGRTPALRNASATNWLAPWTNDIGKLTMYCTDCHGSNTNQGTVVPTGGVDGAAWGPHGSTNLFLLKGWWSGCTGTNTNITTCESNSNIANPANAQRNEAIAPGSTNTQNDLCFKCHNYGSYGGGGTGRSGFGSGNLHGYHLEIVGRLRCMWCHIAVPHGWKNKAFLVNLNDVGPEVSCRQQDADAVPDGYKCTQIVGLGNPMAPGTQMTGPSYTNPPYYRNAMLKLTTFANSGNWSANNCGSVGPPGNGDRGVDWMKSREACDGGIP